MTCRHCGYDATPDGIEPHRRSIGTRKLGFQLVWDVGYYCPTCSSFVIIERVTEVDVFRITITVVIMISAIVALLSLII